MSQYVRQWVARHSSKMKNGNDGSAAIINDALGNMYVTGWTSSSSTGVDFTTIKYSSFGAQEWVSTYNYSGNSEDRAVAIAVDTAGNVYVTGWNHGGSSGYDFLTIKYDRNGSIVWTVKYNLLSVLI